MILTRTDILNQPKKYFTGISADTRTIKNGDLFVALNGSQQNGAVYIQEAIAKGAIGILVDEHSDIKIPEGMFLVYDRHPHQALAEIAAAFYAPMPRVVTAVTGTNGKTSTAFFTMQLWQAMGYESATLGTVGVVTAKGIEEGRLTTPDPITLAQELNRLKQNNIDHIALEASSHGLDQYRLDGLNLAAGGFTYLGRDHLDYHSSIENYFHAKTQLFSRVLQPGAAAVINADCPEYDHLKSIALARQLNLLSFGKNGHALSLKQCVPAIDGLVLTLDVLGRAYEAKVSLTGSFQSTNILCALGLVLGAGASPDKAVAALGALSGAPGRMECVGQTPRGGMVYTDYAHTPDALETVLNALRKHTGARLHVVFGCGGNRDRGKRPIMGSIASALADVVYVTDDNPRFENAAEIRKEILAACPKAIEIADRRKAIERAIETLDKGDILVLVGKGHERGQLIGHEMHSFHDGEIAQNVIHQLETLSQG